MNFLDMARKLGQFVCPHQDGDYTCTVFDMRGWATGFLSIRQEGQGEVHSMMFSKEEAGKLAVILKAFSEEPDRDPLKLPQRVPLNL